MQIVVELPAGCDDVALSNAAARRGVFAPALSNYYARESSLRGLLLGFCAYSGDEMKPPLKILREIAERQFPDFRDP